MLRSANDDDHDEDGDDDNHVSQPLLLLIS